MTASGIALEEVYPKVVSDLWSHKPLIFKAQYSKPGNGTITIKAFKGGKPYEETLKVRLPEKDSANSSLRSLWARARVDDLMDRDLMGIQRGNPQQEVKEEIVKVALSHKIMTQFTSFVAVEETVVTVDGKPTKVTVPVEMPEGVSREGVFGQTSHSRVASPSSPPMAWNATGKLKQQGAAPVSGVLGGRLEAKEMVSKEAAPTERRSFLHDALDSRQPAREREKAETDRPASKFAPELVELLGMKEKPKAYSKGKVNVKNGEVAVQVWLDRSGDELLKLLEEKGLKITFKAATGKMVIGVISVERLEDLAKIPDVRLIEPFTATG
jgi:Ca-activated chloride channel family protein